MKKSLIIFGLTVLLVCVGLSGCTEENVKDKEPQELILGTWKCESADIWYRFKSDGKFESFGDDDEFQWLTQKDMWYTIDDKIHINYYDWYQQSEIFTLSYDYYFESNDRLIVIDEGNEILHIRE